MLICKAGKVSLKIESHSFDLTGAPEGWDTYAMPADVWRSFHNPGADEALLLVISTGDGRKPIEWDADVVAAAAEQGMAMDANGYVAMKKFTDRSQR